jgi:hypothetical protein
MDAISNTYRSFSFPDGWVSDSLRISSGILKRHATDRADDAGVGDKQLEARRIDPAQISRDPGHLPVE